MPTPAVAAVDGTATAATTTTTMTTKTSSSAAPAAWNDDLEIVCTAYDVPAVSLVLDDLSILLSASSMTNCDFAAHVKHAFCSEYLSSLFLLTSISSSSEASRPSSKPWTRMRYRTVRRL